VEAVAEAWARSDHVPSIAGMRMSELTELTAAVGCAKAGNRLDASELSCSNMTRPISRNVVEALGELERRREPKACVEGTEAEAGRHGPCGRDGHSRYPDP
jgi:hypothetical protein